MVAAAFSALCLALLTVLSALIVQPATLPGDEGTASPDARAAAFAAIGGQLLDRYAWADEPPVSVRDGNGQRAPVTSVLIEAAPPAPRGADAGEGWAGEEEETWSVPDPTSPGTDLPAIEPDGGTAAPDLRVFLHVSNQADAGRERAMRVARALEAQGFLIADVRDVAFAVASAKVRYFFAADRPGAERLAREAGLLLGGEDRRRAVPVQDFTHFRPLPTPGNVELWLASPQPRPE